MPAIPRAGDRFPDLCLPDHRERPTTLSSMTAATPYDGMMGFADGYPLILVFYRGFFCPRDGAQMRKLVAFQEELAVNYCKLACVSVDEARVCAAYRYGLGASFPFLSDAGREAIDALGIRDETEEEYPGCARPFTFVLNPDLTVHTVYDGWFFVGRPTLEDLRQDLRAVMARRSNWRYEAYNTDAVKRICIPAERWADGAPALGASGLPVCRGSVAWFSIDDGYGVIHAEDGARYFVRFSGIPGEGYRTLSAGDRVGFEVDTAPNGAAIAVNVQVAERGVQDGPGSLSDSFVSGLNR
jgi:cold shock CspA family protein/peroxiredoxin